MYLPSFFPPGAAAGGIVPFEISFLNSYATSTGTTTRTFSSVNFGTAAASRKILVVGVADSDATGITAINVDGNAASDLFTTAANSFCFSFRVVSLPSGSSGDVEVVMSTSPTRSPGIGVYRLLGWGGSSAFDTANTGSGSFTIDVEEDGVIIGAAWHNGNVVAWTGLTKRYQDDISGQGHTGAMDSGLSAATGKSVSFTNTNAAAGIALSV